MNTKLIGALGEQAAAKFLRQNGYIIYEKGEGYVKISL